MRKLLLICLFLNPFSLLLSATRPWKINKDHSEILFKVAYLKVSEVSGRFLKFGGLAHFDEQYQMFNKVIIKIESSSIFTANSMRDGHLKSKDFLQSKKHPLIIFESESITPMAPRIFKADGFLNLKGIKKPFQLKFKLSEAISDTWGFENRFATFDGKLNRSDFDISWNKSITGNQLLIGDEIHFSGKFQIQPLGKLTPNSKHMIPTSKYIILREKLLRGEITQKEFDDLTYRPPNLKVSIPIVKKEVKPIALEKEETKESEGSTAWIIAYSFVWFTGLIATIIVYIQGKYFFIKLFSKNYDEEGSSGLLTNLILFPLFYLFSWCMWIIGKAHPIFAQ